MKYGVCLCSVFVVRACVHVFIVCSVCVFVSVWYVCCGMCVVLCCVVCVWYVRSMCGVCVVSLWEVWRGLCTGHS